MEGMNDGVAAADAAVAPNDVTVISGTREQVSCSPDPLHPLSPLCT